MQQQHPDEIHAAAERRNSPTAVKCNERVQELLQRTRVHSGTPEWYNNRSFLVTASDGAAILGRDPYRSADDVLLRKRGLLTNDFTNAACKWGIDHEQPAAEAYTRHTGAQLVEEDIGLVLHPRHAWLGATPDRVLRDEPTLVEIKSPFRRVIVPGEVPKHYYDQVQIQLEVCDMDVCHFVQFVPETMWSDEVLDITVVHRDDEWRRESMPRLEAFYHRLVSITPEELSRVAAAKLSRKRKPRPDTPTPETQTVARMQRTQEPVVYAFVEEAAD
jgi:putative phage-type endonuclease